MSTLLLLADGLPGWAQAAGSVVALLVLPTVGWIAAGARRAQRQDTDGRVVDETARTVQRHETTDATMAQAIQSLTTVVGKMDAKLDRALADITATKIETETAKVRADSDRDRIAKLEARADAQDARITREAEAQTNARHALRGEIQGWVTAGIADALEVLRTLAAPRANGGAGSAARRAGRGQ